MDMKRNLLRKSLLGLFLAAAAMTSCQKAADSKKSEPAPIIDTDKKINDVMCSDEILKLSADFQVSQTQTTDIFEQLSIKAGDAGLQQRYKKSGQKQVDLCNALNAQLAKENVSSCLKSADINLNDNLITTAKIDSDCKTTTDFYNRILRQYGGENLSAKSKRLLLQFSDAAKVLIQSKGVSEFKYLANGEIKSGRELLKQDLLDKKITCLFTATAKSSPNESTFRVLSEMSESTFENDQATAGSHFALALEDSSHLMLSLSCMNATFNLAKDGKENLQKILGTLIKIEDKIDTSADLKDSTHLNNDVAAKPQPKQNPEDGKSTAAEAQKKAAGMVDDVVSKAKATIHEVVKDTLVEIKTTTDQTRSETIVEVKKATQELTSEALEHAALVAQKLSEETIKNATAAAEKLSDHIIEKSAAAAQVIADKAIEKASAAAITVSKEVLAESEKTADRVVKNSVKTAVNAVIETATKPLEYVQGKVRDAIEASVDTTKSIYNYFKEKISSASKAVSFATESPYEKLKKKNTETK